MRKELLLTSTVLVFCFIFSFAAIPAECQQEELEEMNSAVADFQEIQKEIEPLQKELDNIRLLYGDPWQSPMRGRAKELMADIGALQSQGNAYDSAYRNALSRYQMKMKPYLELTRLALEQRNVILVVNGNPVVKKRAIDAIDRGLQEISGFSDSLAKANDKILGLLSKEELAAGVLDLKIEAVIAQMGNDPASKDYLEKVFEQMKDHIIDLTASERQKLWIERLGYLSGAIEAYGVLYQKKSQPLASAEIEQLLGVIGLMDKAQIAGLSFPLLSDLQVYLNLFVRTIGNIVEDINYELAKKNLLALTEAANSRTIEDGDNWLGLYPKALFGILGANPKIYPEKTEYKPGEAISGKWYGSFLYAEDAWLGIIPAEHHSTSEKENDRYELTYVYLNGKDTGVFNFEIDLEPGNYVLRMFPSDQGGEMVQEVAISVGSAATNRGGNIVNPQDLIGTWIATGYNCNGTQPPEIISISVEGQKVVATKIKGDACVGDGQVTWEGTIANGVISGRGQVSSGPNTQLYWMDNVSIAIVDRNTLQGWGGNIRRQ